MCSSVSYLSLYSLVFIHLFISFIQSCIDFFPARVFSSPYFFPNSLTFIYSFFTYLHFSVYPLSSISLRIFSSLICPRFLYVYLVLHSSDSLYSLINVAFNPLITSLSLPSYMHTLTLAPHTLTHTHFRPTHTHHHPHPQLTHGGHSALDLVSSLI